MRTEANINTFKNELLTQNWCEVCEEDINKAHAKFWKVFTILNAKKCPISQCSGGQKQTGSPWITKGMKMSAKRKKILLQTINKGITEKKFKIN